MFKRLLTIALVAGAVAGIAVSVVQEFTTTPLILHAEAFEGQSAAAEQSKAVAAGRYGARLFLAHSGETHAEGGEAAWGPEDGLERTFFTSMANVILGIGFALLLAAAFHLHGQPVDGRKGVVWGMAGFAVFSLAPAVGLPPELPGMMAADLVARQAWWISTAVATAAGLALMVFGSNWTWRLGGVLVLVLPHAVGAPHPADIGGNVPPELAGHFAAASLATGAIFWAMLGWLSGTLHQRMTAAD